MGDVTNGKKPRGFAVIPPERRREIAAMGGRAVPAEKRTFSTDPESAREAGRKGGSVGKKKAEDSGA